MRSGFLVVGDGHGCRGAGDEGQREQIVAASVAQRLRLEQMRNVLIVVPDDGLAGGGCHALWRDAHFADGNVDGRERRTGRVPRERSESVGVERADSEHDEDTGDGAWEPGNCCRVPDGDVLHRSLTG